MNLPNGVKARMDGKGDGWSEGHRELGVGFNMQDLDGFFGQMAFAANTGEKLFLEYVPDDYRNRFSCFRKFGVVAFFDRKSTFDYAMSGDNRVSLAFYLWICRTISLHQPRKARFFIVSGTLEPWKMTELDTSTGECGRCWNVRSSKWKEIWEASGLAEDRRILEFWIEKGYAKPTPSTPEGGEV